MYEHDGIVYASQPDSELRVLKARATNDWVLLVEFSNGETRVFDGTRLFDQPVYASLRNLDTFDAFAVGHGILTWDAGAIDIGTQALYELSYEYETHDLVVA